MCKRKLPEQTNEILIDLLVIVSCNNNNKSLNFSDASLVNLPPQWKCCTHIVSNGRNNKALPRTEINRAVIFRPMVIKKWLMRLGGNIVIRFVAGIETGCPEGWGGNAKSHREDIEGLLKSCLQRFADHDSVRYWEFVLACVEVADQWFHPCPVVGTFFDRHTMAGIIMDFPVE